MRIRREKLLKYIPTICITFIVLFVSILIRNTSTEYTYRNKNSYFNIQSVEGVWDLREYDLCDKIQFLDGKVEYIPEMILTPEEFAKNEGKIIYGRVPDLLSAATARIKLLVTPGYYILSSTSVDYNDRIYVNGVLRYEIGNPAVTAEESVAAAGYLKFEVDASDGVIEIVRQGSNFVHKEGGGFLGFWIGSQELMREMIALQELMQAITAGMFLTLFLVHITLWLVFRGYRPNLWFSLLCLAAFIWNGFHEYKIYWTMFPDMSWELFYRIVCIIGASLGPLILLIIYDEFSHIVAKPVLYGFIGVYSVMAVVFLLVDTVTLSRIKIGAEIMLGASALYLIARFIYLVTKKSWRKTIEHEHLFTLLGLAVFMLTAVHDVLRFENIFKISNYDMSGIGILTLVMFQMMAMFYGTMRKYHTAKIQAEELKERNSFLIGLSDMKTEYLANLGHEMKTPLTIISLDVQRAARLFDKVCHDEGVDAEKIRASYARAESEILRVSRMTDNALRFASELETQGKSDVLKTEKLLYDFAEAYRPFVEKSGNELVLSFKSKLSDIYGNSDFFTQVLANLLMNSNTYTKNGRIEITAGTAESMIEISIHDNGSGITPEQLPDVFKRGVSGSGSTGLGLPICKNIIESMGGTINIKSEAGNGTSVAFTLPAYENEVDELSYV